METSYYQLIPYVEASQDIFRDALKAGMIPSVNSLAGVGIVFIPGMMTGEVLSGEDPMLAIRYQIVVMFMVRQRCFSPGHQLLLRPKQPFVTTGKCIHKKGRGGR
ncbi:ABC transporter permease [Desulfobacter postgatei]|uniref:ABC-type uncharacterized transport system, permease component n=1 Tax=Desulfobacter postgatei 2ac9 TaxID=879212 RepID=I5B3N5_9BACT|nr:ABC transporter permease [Desulfobacter postgatei]EIM64098.1 ABC-type uncharacterized transport system, permease component [Desulfobacter postgatei 2ac9]